VPYGDFIPQKALIVDQSDVVQFVSSCLGRSILRNMQLHCQKLPITVRCSVPHTFHLLIFGGMTCTYTTEDAFPAVFASCMRKQFEHDGGYAVLKSPMDVTFDLDCQSTRVSFKYSVYNQAGTLQWPLTFVVPKTLRKRSLLLAITGAPLLAFPLCSSGTVEPRTGSLDNIT
jgi:hypothetical protein